MKAAAFAKPSLPVPGSQTAADMRKPSVSASDSDAHSTTSSMSPSQSPSHSNQSDDGSDVETKQRRPTPAGFSFLDLSYWKRQKVCCGIVYKGRFGEVIIDPRLFKPCCGPKQPPAVTLPVADSPCVADTLPSPLAEDLKETW
ncbi:protein FAM60A-like isoform X1 [Clarias magur]|uniref:Protein FAM60A-like isoform X1 n=1 Tax=Clarias magur TaxID=1594786 RepID=A0A8J4TWA2_CLAMG|nr:protein FAM60A-like isoform X1 [Clarias magur]